LKQNPVIHLYFRYVDDIFAFVQADAVNNFKRIMQKAYDPLVLEWEESFESINFLDLTISWNFDKWKIFVDEPLMLEVSLFQKPANRYQYLHWSSNHKTVIFESIINGEL